MLLRRAAGAEVSAASVSLESLIAPKDEEKSQSCSNACSSTLRQSSTVGNNDDDDAAVSDAHVPSKLIPVKGAKGKDVSTKVSFKRKAKHAEECQTDVKHCRNLNENQHCKNVPSYNPSTSFSSSSVGISGEMPQLAVNRLITEETHLSNGQVECRMKRYGLRKRKPCHLNKGLKTETGRSSEEEKNTHSMDDDDNGTISHQNQLTLVRQKRNSTLTPAHCLVLNQPICCICGLLFSSTADCIMHWRIDHIVTDPSGKTKPHLACQECPVRFALPASRVHSDLHVGIQAARWLNHAVCMHNFTIPSAVERFICIEPGCNFVALTPASYQAHLQKNRHSSVTGHSASSLVYFDLCCFLCTAAEGGQEVFPSKQALREHIIKNHAETDQVREVLLCPVCKVERPLTRARVDDGDRCQPTSCQRFFYVVYRLLHHLVSKHGWSVPEYIQSFPCKFPGCRYIAVAQSDLDSHSISHDSADGSNGSQNPSLPCEKCGKLVRFRAMRSHVRLCQVPAEVRQAQLCPYCKKRLSSQYNVRCHISAVHSGISTSKEFLCSYCTYSCHGKSNLEEHIFHRHGSNVSRRSVVTCSLCPFKTIKQSALRRHMTLVHNDAKTCRCPVCDKMFKCQCE